MLFSVEWEDKFIIIEAEKEEVCRQAVVSRFGGHISYSIWKTTEWDKWYFTEYWKKTFVKVNDII